MDGLRILIVEDEPAIVRMLEPTLSAAGAITDTAWNAAQAMTSLDGSDHDLILCDLGLPDLDGQALVQKIREFSDVPIIILSARGMEHERIKALDAGADDFVPKPFAAGELLARIRAVIRRRPVARRSESIRLSMIEVDLLRRRAIIEGEEIKLSAREHDLLRLLARNAGRVVTHRDIIASVWGAEARAETQSIRVLVGQLRQKLEADQSRPQILLTEPGIGYFLCRD